jgi:hypothetical protein
VHARRTSIAITAGAAGLGVTAGLLIHLAGNRPNTSTTSATTLSQVCEVSTSAFSRPSKLGKFVLTNDVQMTTSPFHVSQLVPPSQRPSAVKDFVVGRMQAYLSSVALQSPYREEEDAVARALHYTVGKWPLVPLTGPVVHDNPTALEVFETHLVYNTKAGAAAALSVVQQSNPPFSLSPDAERELGNSAIAFLKPANPPDGLNETTLGIAVEYRSTLFEFSVRGGDRVDIAEVLPFVVESMESNRGTCPS